MMNTDTRYSAVLFDLDGTLIDSAPDLVGIVNHLLERENRPRLPYSLLRSYVSDGAIALIRKAFGEEQSVAELEIRLDAFLTEYTLNPIGYGTRIFAGVEKLSSLLRDKNWGIVTNKKRVLTELIAEDFPLLRQAPVLVCGGDTSELKPNPAPVLKACQELEVSPEETLFVGDNVKDILAGQRAGTKTMAVLYGYYREEEDPFDWRANYYVNSSEDLVEKLRELLPVSLQ